MSHIITQEVIVYSIEEDSGTGCHTLRYGNEHLCVMLALKTPIPVCSGDRLTVLYDGQQPVVIITADGDKHFVGASQLEPFYAVPLSEQPKNNVRFRDALRFVMTSGMLYILAILLASGLVYLATYMAMRDSAHLFASLASIVAAGVVGNVKRKNNATLCDSTLRYLIDGRNRLTRKALFPAPLAISALMLLSSIITLPASVLVMLVVSVAVVTVLASAIMVMRCEQPEMLLDMPSAYAHLFWEANAPAH